MTQEIKGKIGLYFGTFNPVHLGHLVIANHMAHYTDLDEVWLVVTPHNPHKSPRELMGQAHRLQMVHVAVSENEKLIVELGTGYFAEKGMDDAKSLIDRKKCAHTYIHIYRNYDSMDMGLL